MLRVAANSRCFQIFKIPSASSYLRGSNNNIDARSSNCIIFKSQLVITPRALTIDSNDDGGRRKRLTHSRLQRDNLLAETRISSSLKNYIHNYLTHLMKMDPKIEELLEPLRREVKEQGDIVRALKQNKAPRVDIDAAVRVLKERKKILEDKEASLVPKESFVDKAKLDDTLKRRFFYDISFGIYGGVAGLFDYGPSGTALKKNILHVWDSHFVLEEDLLEIEASQLTPEPVLKASGHVERFADLMVKDLKTGECYRLDHLIKNHLEKICKPHNREEISKILTQLDGLSPEELREILRNYEMKAPATGNELSDPIPFNLMFSSSIGPTGQIQAFLRPETAQGIFVNFKRLLEANSGKLPFGVAQIGKAFRNEISPRGGLVRMREFTMAEIEYFVDPENKKHPKYESIKSMELNLYSACNQMNGEPAKYTSLVDAVQSNVIANEVLAYFLARINLFMLKIGVDPSKIRFRQHMSNEMAHYASDCWDCELLTSTGWLECVGCADRSCFDLTQHAEATNVKLSATGGGKEVVPNVIEPSFGIDRIMYVLLEHNFKVREDNQLRTYFTFPPLVAPIKCSVLPLSNRPEFYPFVEEVMTKLKKENVRPKVDSSSQSIGKRYARTDEIGIPYGITVDFDTLKDKTVTLRSCATTEQLRVDLDSIAELVRDLTNGEKQWDDAKKEWSAFVGQSES